MCCYKGAGDLQGGGCERPCADHDTMVCGCMDGACSGMMMMMIYDDSDDVCWKLWSVMIVVIIMIYDYDYGGSNDDDYYYIRDDELSFNLLVFNSNLSSFTLPQDQHQRVKNIIVVGPCMSYWEDRQYKYDCSFYDGSDDHNDDSYYRS